MSDSRRVLIDVWSDYLCPFCYLDVPVMDSLQSAWGEQAIIRWHAYELYPEPGPPMDPDSPSFKKEWRRVAEMARIYGLVMRPPRIRMRSRPALEAAEVSKDFGVFTDMHRELFRAVYERGEDIGSMPVLGGIAERVGLGAERLERELTDPRYSDRVDHDVKVAEDLGMDGVPTLLVRLPKEPLTQARWVPGVVSYAELNRALEEMLREEAA